MRRIESAAAFLLTATLTFVASSYAENATPAALETGPQIQVQGSYCEWPHYWLLNGSLGATFFSLANYGDETLHVIRLGTVEDPGGPTGWLGVMNNPFIVEPLGQPDDYRSVDVFINASGIVGPIWLDGEVYVISDAVNGDSLTVPVHVLVAAHIEPVYYDTVKTDAGLYDPYGSVDPDAIGLAVGNHGEIGWDGARGGANLDYYETGETCEESAGVYLRSGSPFLLESDVYGGNVQLTSSHYQVHQGAVYSWDPYDPTPDESTDMQHGLSPNEIYDSLYAGMSVNRDTTIAMERTFWAPRDGVNTSFVIEKIKLYSFDGQAHDHLTFGDVCDWDIPSDNDGANVSALSQSPGEFLYMQGTDTAGSEACRTNTTRYGSQAFLGWHDYNTPCLSRDQDFYGAFAGPRTLLDEVDNPQAWWNAAGSHPGLNADATVENQAIWTTFLYDFDLAADDTLFFYTALTTVRNGTAEDLANQVAAAGDWLDEHVYGCRAESCCEGTVGDCNMSGGPDPTIGDISAIIQALYICQPPCWDNVCFAECDVNRSGGCSPTPEDVTIMDINVLIEYLYILGPYDPDSNPAGARLLDCLSCD